MLRFARYWRMPVLGVFVVVLLAVLTEGQSITGSIAGTVVDPNSQVVPGATVRPTR